MLTERSRSLFQLIPHQRIVLIQQKHSVNYQGLNLKYAYSYILSLTLSLMFWLFLLLIYAVLSIKLPLIFTVLILTFSGSAWLSLTIAHYVTTQKFLALVLVKVSSLSVMLCFLLLFSLVYLLQLPSIHILPIDLKQNLALLILGLIVISHFVIMQYYLAYSTFKVVLIILLSLINQLAFILIIGELSAWAISNGWHLTSQRFLM